MTPAPFETVETPDTEVICDGDAGPSGHPRVYLPIEIAVGSVTCPYCSRTFIHRTDGGTNTSSERAVVAPVTGEPATPLDLEKAH